MTLLSSLKRIYRLALCLIPFTFACNPTYQSVRAYIPQQQRAGELQVELGATQADVGYAITDQLTISAGGVYLTQEETSTDETSMNTYTRDSTMYGAHFGLGYIASLSDDRFTRVSISAGSAFQRWELDSDIGAVENSLSLDGFSSFKANIINPFAQLAFTYGSIFRNISAVARFEYPLFDFNETQPLRETADGQPILINYGLQGKFGDVKGISAFFQVLIRRNLDQEHFDNPDFDNGFSVSSWNTYLGFSYAFGAQEPTPSQQGSEVQVTHRDE